MSQVWARDRVKKRYLHALFSSEFLRSSIRMTPLKYTSLEYPFDIKFVMQVLIAEVEGFV